MFKKPLPYEKSNTNLLKKNYECFDQDLKCCLQMLTVCTLSKICRLEKTCETI